MINLEAFGFPAPDPIVGPFNVFDARIGVSQRLVDLVAVNTSRAASLLDISARKIQYKLKEYKQDAPVVTRD